MSKNQEYALQYADYAMLCYFQHNIAYSAYFIAYCWFLLISLLLIYENLCVFLVPPCH